MGTTSTIGRIASRNLWRNTRRTVLTLVAVVVGVAVVVFFRGFQRGFIEMMKRETIEARTGALQVHRKGYMASLEALPTKLNFRDDGALSAKIAAVPGVKAVAPRLVFGGMVSASGSPATFIATAFDPAREYAVTPRARVKLTDGRPLEAADKDGLLVGPELARSLKLGLGAQVSVLAQGPSGAQNLLTGHVLGYPAQTNPFEGKRLLFLPLAMAQELLSLPGGVTEYAVAVDDLSKVDAVAARVREAVGPDYEVHTWVEITPFVQDIVDRQTFIFGLISAVLFAIVVTGIINTMLMSVFERVREIGTMMAVGVKRRSILFMFLAESAVLGLIGAVAGCVLGSALVLALAARGINLTLPGGGKAVMFPEFSVTVLFAVVGAVAGAVVSALYPAWRAAKLRPVEALRAP